MKVGDLIRYCDGYSEASFGVVTSEPVWDQAMNSEAVEVSWLDDGSTTRESANALLDPIVKQTEVISEAR